MSDFNPMNATPNNGMDPFRLLEQVLPQQAKNRIRGMYGVIGIASILLGVALLFWPGHTLAVAAIMLGIYLLISGMVRIVTGHRRTRSARRVASAGRAIRRADAGRRHSGIEELLDVGGHAHRAVHHGDRRQLAARRHYDTIRMLERAKLGVGGDLFATVHRRRFHSPVQPVRIDRMAGDVRRHRVGRHWHYGRCSRDSFWKVRRVA